MRQELEIEGYAHIDQAYDDESYGEDHLNESEAWEIAFEQGERWANEEMVEEWDEEGE